MKDHKKNNQINTSFPVGVKRLQKLKQKSNFLLPQENPNGRKRWPEDALNNEDQGIPAFWVTASPWRGEKTL